MIFLKNWLSIDICSNFCRIDLNRLGENKMKKILLCLLTIFLLSACTSKSTTVELNHDQLIEGDFSSIAGEYVNPNGETVVLGNDGLRVGEVKQDEVYFLGKIYQMNIRRPENEPEGGYTLTV